MSTTTAPTVIYGLAEKDKWILSGCLLVIFGFIIFLLGYYNLYKFIKKYGEEFGNKIKRKNWVIFIGTICMIIGSILLTYLPNVNQNSPVTTSIMV